MPQSQKGVWGWGYTLVAGKLSINILTWIDSGLKHLSWFGGRIFTGRIQLLRKRQKLDPPGFLWCMCPLLACCSPVQAEAYWTLMYSEPFHLNTEWSRWEPSILSLERPKWQPDTREDAQTWNLNALEREKKKSKAKYFFEKFLTNTETNAREQEVTTFEKGR